MDYEKLSSDRVGESSSSIRERVQAARERQRIRFECSDIVCNSDMRVAEVRKFCKLDEAGDSLVRAAMGQLNLSARGYHLISYTFHSFEKVAQGGSALCKVFAEPVSKLIIQWRIKMRVEHLKKEQFSHEAKQPRINRATLAQG